MAGKASMDKSIFITFFKKNLNRQSAGNPAESQCEDTFTLLNCNLWVGIQISLKNYKSKT
jgi:hypothetical protein